MILKFTDVISGNLGICPTLEKFIMSFELSEEATDLLNTSMQSSTDSPNLSLMEFDESFLEDNPPPEPLNQSFGRYPWFSDCKLKYLLLEIMRQVNLLVRINFNQNNDKFFPVVKDSSQFF